MERVYKPYILLMPIEAQATVLTCEAPNLARNS